MSARVLILLTSTAGVLAYSVYRYLRAARLRLLDCQLVLEWLAWRDQRLAYDPPTGEDKVSSSCLSGPRVDALVIHGSSFTSCPIGAADLFIDMLHPAGCRHVLLTGGVGRETPPLWDELAERGLTAQVGWNKPWACGLPPPQVDLPTQGVRGKKVLAGVDLAMEPERLREFCTEADVFLELFVSRCHARGLHVSFGGNPMAQQTTALPSAGEPEVGGAARVYLETASTHTGTNVEYSRATLAAIGFGPDAELAVVQQPQLHMRTCLTWEKQTGKRPLGWTVRPTEAATGRSTSEMLKYALGELQRIPSYAAKKGFCAMPSDFPHQLVQSVVAFEPSFLATLEREVTAKAKRLNA